MKKILIMFSLMLAFCMNSQNFNGKYTCPQTSFQDRINPNNNFQENCNLNVTITYNSKSKSGNCITISDPINPQTKYNYKIMNLFEKMPPGDYYVTSYCFKNCYSEFSNSLVDIVIYYDKENNMNLMISNSKKSQLLKDLKRA